MVLYGIHPCISKGMDAFLGTMARIATGHIFIELDEGLETYGGSLTVSREDALAELETMGADSLDVTKRGSGKLDITFRALGNNSGKDGYIHNIAEKA
jgi:hypothetical protein